MRGCVREQMKMRQHLSFLHLNNVFFNLQLLTVNAHFPSCRSQTLCKRTLWALMSYLQLDKHLILLVLPSLCLLFILAAFLYVPDLECYHSYTDIFHTAGLLRFIWPSSSLSLSLVLFVQKSLIALGSLTDTLCGLFKLPYSPIYVLLQVVYLNICI